MKKIVIHHPVSLGSSCVVAHFFKEHNLKSCSYPYDWIHTNMDVVSDTLSDGFATFMDRDQFCDATRKKACGHKKYHYQMFNHHDPKNDPADYAYYERCIARFYDLLVRPESKLFLLIYTNMDKPLEEYSHKIYCLNKTLAKMTKNYKLLFIHQTFQKDLTQSLETVRESDTLTIVKMRTKSASDGLQFGLEEDNKFLKEYIFGNYEFVPSQLYQDESVWIEDQVRFWYGNNTNKILDDETLTENDKWNKIGDMIHACDFGKRVSGLLDIHDTNEEAVATKYGECGAYRFNQNVKVLKDWIKHDLENRLTEEHRFPILLVDCIGPWVPLIGYNRVVRQAYAILWPLEYHYDLSMKGLKDTESFARKIDKVVFRGALSGPFVSESVLENKSSRVDVVYMWEKANWADMGISFVPKHIESQPDYPTHKDRINACMKEPIPLEKLMGHKYVVCIEGADVSSGFGWALASNCVPIHPYPFAYEVWFFNGLKPWVHFIPIKPDGEGLDRVYEWCKKNPEKCAAIAANGRSFMKNMLDVDKLFAIKRDVVKRWNLQKEHVSYQNP